MSENNQSNSGIKKERRPYGTKPKRQFTDGDFPISKPNIQKLINAARNFRDRFIIETLYYSAMRRFEVSKMKVTDIDLETGRIRVIGKFGKDAVIPVGSIFPEYIANLKIYIGNRKDGYVFQSNRGNKINESRINQIVSETAKLAGLKNPNPRKKHINPHALRHSMARHLKDEGYTIEYIQNYLRHDSFETTFDVYGKLSVDEMERQSKEKRVN